MSNNYTERSLTGHIIAKGEAGKTAYEYALAGGFTGTEEDFAILLANQGGVKSVNGAEPDENGNIEIDIPEGFSGSWNDLEDKPFGEAMVGAVDFEWDGNLSGFEVYEVSLPNDDEEPFIKISDIVPINVDLQTISGIKCDADGLLEFSRPLSDFDIQDGYISYHDSFVTSGPRFGDAYIYIVMTEEGAAASGFPSTGIYVAFDGEYEGVARYYFKEIHLSAFEGTIKIPEKYIPDHPHSWNDLEDKPFYDTRKEKLLLKETFTTMVPPSTPSEDLFTVSVASCGAFTYDNPGAKIRCVMDGDEYIFEPCVMRYSFDGVEYNELLPTSFGNVKPYFDAIVSSVPMFQDAIVEFEGATYPDCNFAFSTSPEYDQEASSIFYFYNETEPTEHTVEIYLVEGEFKQLDEKYIPEHPHSWNDLEDKPFGTETETTDIMLEESVIESVTSPDVIGIDADVYYVEAPYNVVKEFKAGEEYAVIFDGTEYRCLINEIVAPEGRFIQLGNFSVGEPILNAMGGALPMDEINDDWTNNDCPFYMHCVQLYSETVFPLNVVTNFDSTGSTFSIYHVVKEIKKIDAKYLPLDEILGVIENGTY